MPSFPNDTSAVLHWIYLGRLDFASAMKVQSDLHRRIVNDDTQPDTVIFLEHEPTISCGRHTNMNNVLFTVEQLSERGIRLEHIDRGGDVTFHGPGQLVCYPVRRVRTQVKTHVDGVTRVLQELLLGYGIPTDWSDENPGLWTSQGKIAALGMRIREGVSLHGFALNVNIDLNYFSCIIPCGLKKPVDRMIDHRGNDSMSATDFSSMSAAIAQDLVRSFGYSCCENIKRLPADVS